MTMRAMRRHRVILAALAWMLGVANAQAACPGDLPEQGRVAALVDARTVRLDDGRMLRLAGLELLPDAPQPVLPAGTAASLAGVRRKRPIWPHRRDSPRSRRRLARPRRLKMARSSRLSWRKAPP